MCKSNLPVLNDKRFEIVKRSFRADGLGDIYIHVPKSRIAVIDQSQYPSLSTNQVNFATLMAINNNLFSLDMFRAIDLNDFFDRKLKIRKDPNKSYDFYLLTYPDND